MAYVEKYRLSYSDPDANRFWVKIYEDGFAGDLTYLTPAVDAVQYQLIDNDENPYLPIQGSELVINFISENNFSLKDLFESGSLTDTKYKVEWYSVGDVTSLLWVGFLDTESCSEPIVDDPRVVTLRAVDGLGFLKNSGFTNENNEFQYGKYTLLQCIEWCLVKTELELDLHVSVSIFEESMSDRDDNPVNEPFKQCKIHTRSIKEKNCYEVMQEICRAFACTLYQANGVWVIERKHDRWNLIWNNRPHYTTIYEYPYVSDTATSVTYTFNHTSFTPLTGHSRFFLSPYKDVTTTYNYIAPPIPRNKNFEGTFLPLFSSGTNSANAIDYWVYQYGSISSPSPVATIPYRNQVYDSDGIKIIDTYLILPRNNPTVAEDERLICESIEVSEGDKVVLSFEHRFKFDVSGSGNAFMAQLILYGDSGQKYTLDESTLDLNEQGTWTETLTSGTGQVIQRSFGSGDDLTEWLSFSITTQGLPEDGLLALWLYEGTPSGNSNETWFRNVKLEMQFFVNDRIGISGQRTEIEQDATYRASYEGFVTIGDAPKKLINGALFRATDDTELTTGWYLHDGPDSTLRPLIQYTNRAHFQFRHRFKTKVEGTIKNPVLQHPADNANTVIQPCVELEYGASTMEGIKYIPTNLTINSSEGQATVYLMEFYKDDETTDPLGDDENIFYLYE